MKTFEELGVIPKILKAIVEIGYRFPMPIQEEVIPYLLGKGNEVIALAQTGTGKTAAFGIPVLQQIHIRNIQPQALILCPTRELCLQITGDMNDYSKYMEKLKILPIYGGVSIKNQIRAIKQGVHIVVATPGRLIDLIHRCMIDLQEIKNVILDEADEMLNMGFSEDIDEILQHIPQSRNMLLFSATMPVEIARITKQYMHNPHEILVGKRNEGANNIRHMYYLVNVSDKYLLLKRLVDYYPNIYGIIFCRTKNETQEIADLLIKDGYNADSLHGDLSQIQRDHVMRKFRLRYLQLLVATDVAARGLDVNDLSHIIHYGLPDEVESYTHRSGRTGRAGKAGMSIAIVYSKDKQKIKLIEKSIHKVFERGTIPSWRQICQKQLFNFIDKLEKVQVNDEEIQEILFSVYHRLERLDKEELIKRLISNEFNRLINYYKEASNIESPTEEKRNKVGSNKEKTIRMREKGYARLFINLGKMDGLTPRNLIGIFNESIPGRKVEIGKIDLMQKFSFFEVKEVDRRMVMQHLDGVKALDRKIRVESIKK